ncbi:MAG: sodium:proton antiporter [Rhodospirillales bacterium]|nr:sodium:proton antiporter [Rhodospirillales bacterium]
MRKYGVASFAAAIVWLLPLVALAAAGGGHGDAHAGAPHLDGAQLGLLWAVPFAGILLSIAVFPLAAPHFWEEHFGKVSAFWVAVTLVPFFIAFGWELTLFEVLHLLLLEYFPFIILLLALFTVAGGIHFQGSFQGSPASNTAFLAAGTAIASWTGTTGASMLLIRPVMRANAARQNKVHVIIFFIFLVSNVGGALTPLGDPPLFLGFLKGVDFFWPTVHVFAPMLVVAIPLLVIFFAMDTFFYRRESESVRNAGTGDKTRVGINGWANVGLLACVVGAVLLSGMWKPGITFTIYHVEVELQNLVRDVLLLVITWVSWSYTDREHRKANAFNWGPILEVAKLFAGIFVTIMPVIAILKAGEAGALKSVVSLVSEGGKPVDAMYFWVTGALSSFLDNAPTYLVFFNAAGGEADMLMGSMGSTLMAISAGAVFMGANSYIGNAPNFMVKAIAESAGVKMPSFFGYLAWSGLILLPLFAVVTFIFFL